MQGRAWICNFSEANTNSHSGSHIGNLLLENEKTLGTKLPPDLCSGDKKNRPLLFSAWIYFPSPFYTMRFRRSPTPYPFIIMWVFSLGQRSTRGGWEGKEEKNATSGPPLLCSLRSPIFAVSSRFCLSQPLPPHLRRSLVPGYLTT